MTRIVFLLMLSLAASGFGQTEKQPDIEKIFQPKNLQGENANRAIRFVADIMAGRARIHWEPTLRQAMIIGTPEHVAHAEQLLRKFDVAPAVEPPKPTKSVEFTIHLVGAYVDPTSARGSPVPASLESVVKEMRSAFGYKAYALLDTIPVTARTFSGTEYNGILPTSAVGTNLKHFYKIVVNGPQIVDDDKTIAVELKFTVEVPSEASGTKAGESGIGTSLTIREGQKIVLGKIKLDAGDNAVFLVVTAKIL